jgi:hypothetical protein
MDTETDTDTETETGIDARGRRVALATAGIEPGDEHRSILDVADEAGDLIDRRLGGKMCQNEGVTLQIGEELDPVLEVTVTAESGGYSCAGLEEAAVDDGDGRVQ